ncbi:MAG: DedA family protein [Dehalococcoidales bacterium]|nr:DedA family protein [Dehalococcoidales bacterium]
MGSLEQAIVGFIQSVYTSIQWPGVVVLMAVESACIPLPSEIVMPLAGWMLIKGQNLPVAYTLVAGVYGAIGCTIGSLAAYYVGKQGGRPFLTKYGKYFLISHHDLDLADRWFEKKGSLTAFVSRLLPVVRTFISVPAGIARMNLLKFIVYAFLGSFIWCTFLAYAGYQLGEHWEQIRVIMRPFDVPIIAAVLILVAYYLWRHLKKGKT